jgi:hypothetical protein
LTRFSLLWISQEWFMRSKVVNFGSKIQP